MRRRTLLSASSGGGIDPTTGRGTIGDYEVVDLGLPSGLLWATCNVGATKEEGLGNYYMYGKGTRKYNSSDSYYQGTEDPLASSADTATQVMKNGWRMPTQTEFIELSGNTTYSWTTINGINGGKFTSKTNPNAYVFFPAAGDYYDGSIDDKGSSGFVWSSTPSGSRHAYYLYFGSGYKYVYSNSRDCGFSVRGVHNKPGEPMPPMSVLFVNKNDTTQKQIFEKDDWPAASDWTPIGIVVVPSSHNRYGDNTNGVMSLGCLNTDGTMQPTGTPEPTDNVTMQWGGYGTDTSLTNYTTCDGSNTTGFVQGQAYSTVTTLRYLANDTRLIVYPYTDLTATENSVISNGSLSDYDGVGNTNILNASASAYVAAAACKKFYTIGTSAGDWYLPACGELAYLPSIRYQVNDTISALNSKYGTVGVQLNTDVKYWSSSEWNYMYAWMVSMYNGFTSGLAKNDSAYVRAFLRF